MSSIKATTGTLNETQIKGLNKEGTIYQPILDQVAKLRKHGAFVRVPLTGKTKIDDLHNRLNSVMRRYGTEPPKGFKYIKRTEKPGNKAVLIVLVENGTPGSNRGSNASQARKPRAHKKVAKKAARKPSKKKASKPAPAPKVEA